jgi:hypothetical protein
MQNIYWLLLGLGFVDNGKLAISDTETGGSYLAHIGVVKFEDLGR